jgi:7,8-dihydropterin-6-yl-methyl-4-(beta-D-ribofuranosyl)aminobenzene 5'-phosphate synthase
MVYLGEIERVLPFEQECSTPFHFADGSPDSVTDDSALAIKTANGLFVISGCAHAGICNIVEQARRVTGTDKVFGVIGGFHLTAIDNRLTDTIGYLKNIGCEIVMPSHCTSDEAIAEFHKHFKGETVKTGMVLEF